MCLHFFTSSGGIGGRGLSTDDPAVFVLLLFFLVLLSAGISS